MSEIYGYFKRKNALLLVVLYQLQDLIVTLDVMLQFEQFLHQIKAVNSRIQMVQLMLSKIQMMKPYMEIK